MAVTPAGVFHIRNIGVSRMYQNQSPALQSAISAASSGLSQNVLHHPITCNGRIAYDEQGVFSCDHSKVPPDDPRSIACIIHSIAVLIVEEAYHYTGMKDLPYDRAISTEND